MDIVDRMTASDILTWRAYDLIEPIGAERADFMVAQLTALLFNTNRGAKQKASGAIDFMPFGVKPEAKAKTKDAAKALFAGLSAALGRKN